MANCTFGIFPVDKSCKNGERSKILRSLFVAPGIPNHACQNQSLQSTTASKAIVATPLLSVVDYDILVKLKISIIDKKFLDQVTCIEIFNCNLLWYLVDVVAML